MAMFKDLDILERIFIILALLTFLILTTTIIYHSYKLNMNVEDAQSISQDMLFNIFLVSIVYFLIYIIVIIGNIELFFVKSNITGKTLVFIFIISVLLTLLVVFGVYSNFHRDQFNNIFITTLPSLLLSLIIIIFDVSVSNRNTLNFLNVTVLKKWEQVFTEALKVDIAILLSMSLLVGMSLVFYLNGADDNIESKNLVNVYIVTGEAYTMFIGTILFTIESLFPYWNTKKANNA